MGFIRIKICLFCLLTKSPGYVIMEISGRHALWRPDNKKGSLATAPAKRRKVAVLGLTANPFDIQLSDKVLRPQASASSSAPMEK